MKTTLRLLMLVLLAGGLTFSAACKKNGDKKEDEDKAKAEETKDEEESGDEEEDEEAEKEEEKEKTGEIDQDMFIEAAYQVACVNKTIEDPEKRKSIKKEIYARYGFDESTFNEAQNEMGEDATVSTAIETRLEKCNKEMAEGFAEAGPKDGEKAEDGEKGEEGKGVKVEEKGEKKPATPKPVATGNFKGNVTTGLESGEIMLTVRKDFSVDGTLKGKNEGKRFRLTLRGRVKKSDKKTVEASGKSGKTQLTLRGEIKGSKLTGTLKGKVFSQDMNGRFSLSN